VSTDVTLFEVEMFDFLGHFQALLKRARKKAMDADDRLYNYEAPMYRYCATGFPMQFGDKEFYAKWDKKRNILDRHNDKWKAIVKQLKEKVNEHTPQESKGPEVTTAGSFGETNS
jgi:hypothetical protein